MALGAQVATIVGGATPCLCSERGTDGWFRIRPGALASGFESHVAYTFELGDLLGPRFVPWNELTRDMSCGVLTHP